MLDKRLVAFGVEIFLQLSEYFFNILGEIRILCISFIKPFDFISFSLISHPDLFLVTFNAFKYWWLFDEKFKGI